MWMRAKKMLCWDGNKMILDITISSLHSCSLSTLFYLHFNLFILPQMYDGFVNLSIPSQKVLQFSCLSSLPIFALIAALSYSKNVSLILQYFHLNNLTFLILITLPHSLDTRTQRHLWKLHENVYGLRRPSWLLRPYYKRYADIKGRISD
jgi:hypothetical protein